MKKAVVLLSGGLDSTTCLALATAKGFACAAISFAYGQRHSAELQAAQRIAHHYKVIKHHIVTLDTELFRNSALTDTNLDVPAFQEGSEIPVTYVPARNHYPDCRPEFIEAFQTLANLATKAGVTGDRFSIHAPLQHLSKVQTIQLGISLGVDYSLTVSCYQANDAGEACGECDSCTFRRRGFSGAGVADPTLYHHATTK